MSLCVQNVVKYNPCFSQNPLRTTALKYFNTENGKDNSTALYNAPVHILLHAAEVYIILCV